MLIILMLEPNQINIVQKISYNCGNSFIDPNLFTNASENK